jgi:hypothetical protein
MKKTLVALLLAAVATAAWASCRYYTVTTPDGRVMHCSECCYSGQCFVRCN